MPIRSEDCINGSRVDPQGFSQRSSQLRSEKRTKTRYVVHEQRNWAYIGIRYQSKRPGSHPSLSAGNTDLRLHSTKLRYMLGVFVTAIRESQLTVRGA